VSKRRDTDFVGGMYTGMANSARAKADGQGPKVFDWNKAATLIAERKPKLAEAGLAEDWNNTSGTIFEDGDTCSDSYCYLYSAWATPLLVLDGEEIECYTDASSGWGANTLWPKSALELLETKK
jgi:hypothetical protein